MPLYAGHDGAQAKINKLYAGIDGSAKEIEFLYAGVNGVAKEVFVGIHRWKKYALGTGVNLVYVRESGTVYLREEYYNRYIFYTDKISDIVYSDGDAVFATSFAGGKCSYYQVLEENSYHSTIGNRYVPFNGSSIIQSNSVNNTVTSSYVLLVTNSVQSGRVSGEVYAVEPQKGSYIETVKATKADAYPMNGAQGGYWYVYDGEVTWSKHSINQISEPSTFGSSSSFSNPSASNPYLMASQAKRDSNGNVDWGTTYTATTSTMLQNNYNNYPYCSMSSTLDADNLYKITSASLLSCQRQQVTGWAVTSESAGDYIGDVTGKIGDYPENGKQDGYWYIMQEIV